MADCLSSEWENDGMVDKLKKMAMQFIRSCLSFGENALKRENFADSVLVENLTASTDSRRQTLLMYVPPLSPRVTETPAIIYLTTKKQHSFSE